MIVDYDSPQAIGSGGRHPAHRLRHLLGNFHIAKSLRFRLQGPERIEQQNLAAYQRSQVLLHGLKDSCRRMGGGKPLRECIEVADLVFPLLRAGGITARLRRKITEHQRDNEKDDEAKDARSRIGAGDIEWAVEEEGHRRRAADGRYGGR